MSNDFRRGKYFRIRSKECPELAVEVIGSVNVPGAMVVLGQAQSGQTDSHQLWYLDKVSNTLRNGHCGMCLDLNDDSVAVVNPFRTSRPHQRFRQSDQMIHQADDMVQVLSVLQGQAEPGCPLTTAPQKGAPSQKWIFEYMSPEYFHIRSHDGDQVLDVDRLNKAPGALVILYKEHDPPADNQLWYENEDGVVCSKLNGFCFRFSGGHINMQPYGPTQGEQFIFLDHSLRNRFNPEEALEAELKRIDRTPNFAKFGRKISGAFGTNQKLKKGKFTGAVHQIWQTDIVTLKHDAV